MQGAPTGRLGSLKASHGHHQTGGLHLHQRLGHVPRLPSAAVLAKAMKESRLATGGKQSLQPALVGSSASNSQALSALQARVRQLEAENSSLRKRLSDVGSCRTILAEIHSQAVLSMEHLMRSVQLSQMALNELAACKEAAAPAGEAALSSRMDPLAKPTALPSLQVEDDSNTAAAIVDSQLSRRLTTLIESSSEVAQVVAVVVQSPEENSPAEKEANSGAQEYPKKNEELKELNQERAKSDIPLKQLTVEQSFDEPKSGDLVHPESELQKVELENRKIGEEDWRQELQNCHAEEELKQPALKNRKELKQLELQRKAELKKRELKKREEEKLAKVKRQEELRQQDPQRQEKLKQQILQKPEELKEQEFQKQEELEQQDLKEQERKHQELKRQEELKQQELKKQEELRQQELKKQEELRQHELKRQEELRHQELKQQELKQQELKQQELKQQELKKQEELRQQELKTQEELKRQELKRQEELRQQELKRQEELKQQELQKQEELELKTQKTLQRKEEKVGQKLKTQFEENQRVSNETQLKKPQKHLNQHQTQSIHSNSKQEGQPEIMDADDGVSHELHNNDNNHQLHSSSIQNPFVPRHRLARTPPKADSSTDLGFLDPVLQIQPPVQKPPQPPTKLSARRGTFVIGQPPKQPMILQQPTGLLTTPLAEIVEAEPLPELTSPIVVAPECVTSQSHLLRRPSLMPVAQRQQSPLEPKRRSSSRHSEAVAGSLAQEAKIEAEVKPETVAPPAPKRHRRKASSSAAVAAAAAADAAAVEEATGPARPRRQRAVCVNYKEPSVNQKVRRGDPNWCKSAGSSGGGGAFNENPTNV